MNNNNNNNIDNPLYNIGDLVIANCENPDKGKICIVRNIINFNHATLGKFNYIISPIYGGDMTGGMNEYCIAFLKFYKKREILKPKYLYE